MLSFPLGTALLLALALHEPAQTAHFSGEIRAGNRSCAIELELGEKQARVDLPSRWSLGLEVEVQRDGEARVLRLPELGTLRLTASADGLAGVLAADGGRTAEVRLARTPAARVRSEEVAFASGELTLAATLGLPDGPGPHPALVLVPGGGDSMRTQSATRFLCEYLPRFGFACLVYDKRGSGASQGDWRAVGLAELAGDALAAVAALRARADIDARRVGFFAASQGTWVALEACARAEPPLAFLVNHSGPAVPLLEADTFAIRSSARAAGLAPVEEEEVLALWRLECEALRLGVAPADHAPLLAALEQARARPWFARMPYEATPASSWWVGWYARVLEHDPRAGLAALTLPTLWLYGSADTQSDVVASMARVGEGARRDSRPWSLHLFPGGDHGILVPLFADAPDSPRTMASGYFELLFDWLRNVAGE
jgi:pimeloyl-ACP methyl ester carboxylesterase